MSDFHYTLFKGNVFKELVKVLFEKSGYTVIPYGYENPFSNVKNRLNKKLEDSSRTARRIRHSPDLLIYDEQTEDVRLVEVKMSSYSTPQIRRIKQYQEFWGDAILVMVLPFENVFYAQEISCLGIKDKYDPASDFERIQDVFAKIDLHSLKKYGNVATKLIEAMKSKEYTDAEQPQ